MKTRDTTLAEMEQQLLMLEAEDVSKRKNGIMHYINPYLHLASLLPPPKPQQYIRQEDKIGRNDLCPCGSGKKYKKCCLNE